MSDIIEMMKYVVNQKCSDLHLSAGEKPIVRKSGELHRLDHPVLSSDDLKSIVKEITTETQFHTLEEELELDFSYAIEGFSRYRINAFYQSRGLSLSLRTLSYTVPTLEEIHIVNPIFKKMTNYPNGLVLITGATGSGKSTTLAALINEINSNPESRKHILTIEDPIEYVFKSKSCLIQQREVGKDTKVFQHALRAALREDPDIIMVGEMRDLETIRLALTASETGHLVFATLHTSSAAHAIDRIIDVFPGGEKDMIRAMLAESLRAVIAQRLFKTPDGGVHPAHEILMCTGAVRNLIREHKIAQMYSAMQTGRQYGMNTMEQNIAELLENNIILRTADMEPGKESDNLE
ncbi:MAG: twitching motility protein PilT [Gammaproteobacteria bacterium CG_4_10_14_0_8_um_filter_38_16]|nr:MAG: twitching motility protein PilT [Gammaproteobacteria bacterium CG_4_10_14_0_8_um_filter_38_16]PJA03645.1 MAG: twitching motility protein PilT [Gammaproteobacteria bacterium CG_4_10_14_0_2_um_filter_38_22]PJB11311.1 MAG: twitching motility protein PilT [Gammaproteobacteria bacterium CG_4_9_14_3_um_filter_38_9]